MYRAKSTTFTSDLLRNPIFLLGLVCLAFLSLKKLVSALRFGPVTNQVATYNYEMVREREARRILSLGDYPTEEKEHHWQAPQDRAPMTTDALVKNTAGGPNAPSQNPAAQLPVGKKGVMTSAAAKAQQARRARMKVDILAQQQKAQAAANAEQSSAATFNDVVYYNVPAGAASFEPDARKQAAEEDKLKMSLNEWRSLLSTPNRANMDKLLAAKRTGKISNADFYVLVKELMTSHADDRQTAGVYALRNDVTAATFEFIVTNKSQAVDSVQSQLSALLKIYQEPAQVDELAKVLASSKNGAVVLEAMKDLTVSVASLKKQVSAQSDGSTRNPAVAAQATRDLLSLVPSLQRVSKGGQEYASMAQELLIQIESVTQKS